MAQTTTVDISSHVMDYVLQQLALRPLFNKYVWLSKINRSNIDGEPTGSRKIAKQTKLTEAEDDDEGVDFTDISSISYDTPVTLTPTKKAKRINTTITALTRRMPGMRRAEVIQAVRNGDPSAVPMLIDAAELIRDAHLQRAEREVAALASGASESAGTTTQNLSFATIVDAQTKLLDNNPAHEGIVGVFTEVGIGDLRSSVVSGSGAALSSVWSDGFAQGFLDLVPDPSRVGFRGSCLGMPLFAGDKNLMATANAGADSVGAVFCMGAGATGDVGSLRGFAEFCEGFSMEMLMEFDLIGDNVDLMGRWAHDMKETTDPHIVQVIFGIT